jgi:hypothetical protein
MSCFQTKRFAMVIVLVGLIASFGAMAQAGMIVHDYRFAATGSANDQVGTANATLAAGASVVPGTGLVLTGAADSYATLPTGASSVIPANATSVTIDAWFTQSVSSPASSWVYFLGSQWVSGAPGAPVDWGRTYVGVMPSSAAGGTETACSYQWGDTRGGGYDGQIHAAGALNSGTQHHIQVKLSDVTGGLYTEMFVDGSAAGTPITVAGSSIALLSNDASSEATLHNYLGKTAFPDPMFIGSISQLSISATVTPEPGTCVLLTSGLIGLLAYAWRKRK